MADARVVVRGKDEVSGVLDQTSAKLRRWAVEAQGAGERFSGGFAKASNAITNLAGDLLGVNNKVSNVAEGLLTLGAGGAVTAAVGAGIALLTAGFLSFTKQAREAEAAYNSYLDSLRKTSTLAIVGAQLDELNKKLAKLRDPGIPGAVSRFKRQVLSQTFLGQLFGIQSEEELNDQVRQAETLYRTALQDFDAARRKTNKEFADKAAKEAQAARDKQLAEVTQAIGAIKPTVVGGSGSPLATRQAPEVQQLLPEGDRQIDTARHSLIQLGEVVANLEAGFADLGDSIGGTFEDAIAGGQGFLGSLETIRKSLGRQARVHAAHDFVASISALGRGLFTGDPKQFAAATQLGISSAAWFALSAVLGGGGGGGGGSRSSGVGQGQGAVSPAGFERNAQETGQRGNVTLVLPRGAILDHTSPEFQQLIVDTVNESQGRRLTIRYA